MSFNPRRAKSEAIWACKRYSFDDFKVKIKNKISIPIKTIKIQEACQLQNQAKSS